MPSSLTSDVEVANLALSHLGLDPIDALDDDTSNTAIALNTVYARVRDALFREYRWNFLIKREEIAEDPTAPAFGKAHRYQLPADYIRFIEPDPIDNFVERDWKVEGAYLLTNDASPLELRYLSRVEDPSQWDDVFAKVFALDLACAVCLKLTESPARLQLMEEKRAKAMNAARRANAFEGVSHQQPEGKFTRARRMGITGRMTR